MKYGTIEKGETVLLSTGEYSDYSVKALCLALETFNTEDVIKEYLAINPDETDRYSADFFKFINWLVNERKVLEEIKHREWHLGDYSSFEETFITEGGAE